MFCVRHYILTTSVILALVGMPSVDAARPNSSEPVNCERYLIEHLPMDQQILHYQKSASSNQVVTRGLSRYLVRLSGMYQRLIKGRHNPKFHWLDVGGGTGTAALESFVGDSGYSVNGLYDSGTSIIPITGQHQATVVSYENLFDEMIVKGLKEYKDKSHLSMNTVVKSSSDGAADSSLVSELEVKRVARIRFVLNDIAKKQTAAGRFKYLSGRYFEDIPDSELAQADLITDYFGAFAYSKNKFEILAKFARLLKPQGLAVLYADLPLFHIANEAGKMEEINLAEFLKIYPVDGLEVSEYSREISLRRLPNTIAQLERLAKMLEVFHIDHEHLPPTFRFRIKNP